MSTPTDKPNLATAVNSSWHSFLETIEPLRPELYRYCRCLTRSPWDAEDLVQDVMARAFVTLGCVHQEITNPRAWLFRVGSNLWLNQVGRSREQLSPVPDSPVTSELRAAREAGGTLLVRLSPQERAAVVLKDVFDFTLEEIAAALSTTTGAVKAALHRGRGKLSEPEPSPEAQTPTPAVLDAFCAAFNAGDLDRLTALLLDSATVEAPGLSIEYGPEAARRGSFRGALFGHEGTGGRGIALEYHQGLLAKPPRVELRLHRGEPILLGWWAHEDGEAVRNLVRVETDGDFVSRVRSYFHTPEVIAEICRELNVPFRLNGYRYWG